MADTINDSNNRDDSSRSHDLTGSVLVNRIRLRVRNEAMKCKDGSHAKDTLRWVLEVIREEQNSREDS